MTVVQNIDVIQISELSLAGTNHCHKGNFIVICVTP